jgi:hypothetical protein
MSLTYPARRGSTRKLTEAAADEVGVAVDREDVLCFGGVKDFVELVLGVGDVRSVVLALRVVNARDGPRACGGVGTAGSICRSLGTITQVTVRSESAIRIARSIR